MMTLTLSLVLAAAPIPKTVANYEGQIGVLVVQPEPQVLLLQPNGKEVTRVSLKGIEGTPYAIRLARKSEFAVITFMTQNNTSKVDYVVPLTGKEKPRKLWESDSNYTSVICLTSDGKTAFASTLNLNALRQNQGVTKFEHWKIDVKTGKKDKYDLGEEYNICDLSQDPADFILATKRGDNNTQEASLINIETKKVTKTMTDLVGAPLLIANAKSVMLYAPIQKNGQFRYEIQVRDFGSTDAKTVPLPDENGVISNIRSVGADNEHVAFSYVDAKANPFGGFPAVPPGGATIEVQIVVANFKKNSSKAVYKTKEGEVIQDFDWR